MIGKLTGTIDTLSTDHVILDVGGVGYVVFGSSTMLSGCPGKGEKHSLVIETHVREDQITLYGFASEYEKSWYKLLISVQGVGSRVALAILSTHQPDYLAAIISAQDKKAMAQADGVGPKLAGRIVSELADKVGSLASVTGISVATSSRQQAVSSEFEDAVLALTNLGYSRVDAAQAVSKVQSKKEDIGLNQMIKEALQELAA